MDSTQVAPWVAAGLIGFAQPFVQEIISRGKVIGRPAVWLTLAVSFVAGALAVWLTGGLALVHVPAFTAADPSPLFFVVLDQGAKIALVARITYAIPGIGATPAKVVVTPAAPATAAAPATPAATVVEPGKPGLVQKVAGTGDGASPAVITPSP